MLSQALNLVRRTNKRTSNDNAYDKCWVWVLYVEAQDKSVGIPPDGSVKSKEGFSWEVKLEPC